MNYVAKNTIYYDGKTFRPGEFVTGIAKGELQYLLEEKAIEEKQEKQVAISSDGTSNTSRSEEMEIEGAIVAEISKMTGSAIEYHAKLANINQKGLSRVDDKRAAILDFYKENEVVFDNFTDEQLGNIAKNVGIELEVDADREAVIVLLNELFDTND